MKIIDLLNKIANGEEVPKKILYNDYLVYELDEYNHYMYKDIDNKYLDLYDKAFNCELDEFLNDTIEILEEEKKTPTFNDIRESYGLPRIEEKKIPEKLNKQHFHNRQRQLANKINEIIICLQEKNKND